MGNENRPAPPEDLAGKVRALLEALAPIDWDTIHNGDRVRVSLREIDDALERARAVASPFRVEAREGRMAVRVALRRHNWQARGFAREVSDVAYHLEPWDEAIVSVVTLQHGRAPAGVTADGKEVYTTSGKLRPREANPHPAPPDDDAQWSRMAERLRQCAHELAGHIDKRAWFKAGEAAKYIRRTCRLLEELNDSVEQLVEPYG